MKEFKVTVTKNGKVLGESYFTTKEQCEDHIKLCSENVDNLTFTITEKE